MTKKLLIPCIIIILIGIIFGVLISAKKTYVDMGEFSVSDFERYITDFPSDILLGYVNDEKNAAKQAENVFIDIYGKKGKRPYYPYRVYFDKVDKVWLVIGDYFDYPLLSLLACDPYILIRQSDGKVLAVWHTDELFLWEPQE